MSDLAEHKCVPCEGGVEPMTAEQVASLLQDVNKEWQVTADGKIIRREFVFPAYSRTIAFANAVAWVATTEGHHPDMLVSYSRCVVEYTTHAIGGLSNNDFICAAKIDRLFADA